MGLDLERGDKATIAVADLLDGSGNPTTFSAGDILRFTVKRDTKSIDAKALIRKSSDADPGGIDFTPDTASATITILGTDWANVSVPINTTIVWDLQIAINGDPDQVFTLAQGPGRIVADVTLTAP